MSDARRLVVQQLAPAAARFPDLSPDAISTASLDDRDARLAVAIHRTVLQRWLTLEHMLDHYLKKPCAALEPRMQAVLLSGAAQLLFFEKLPAHAVVSESVKLARSLVRPGAAGMVNAVLRRVAESVASRNKDAWRPAPDLLPVDGGCVQLSLPLLPPVSDFAGNLAAATSCPQRLIHRWCDQFGEDQAVALALHALKPPPTIVTGINEADAVGEDFAPHEQAGCYIWQGSHEALKAALKAHPQMRVQDAASTLAVASLGRLGIEVSTAIDYCAGRGTKTRQLAAAFPACRIFATDTDKDRRDALTQVAKGLPLVEVLPPAGVRGKVGRGGADLLLLDVPCSNTGVLARRPEARYRFDRESVQSLRLLQQQIIETTMPLVRPGGYILYSTCSLEQSENQDQTRWLTQRYGGEIVDESLTLPGGDGPTYHDGSYHALVRISG